MNDHLPIIGTIVVSRPLAGVRLSGGVLAHVNGRPRFFPNLEAVFRAAVNLLDAESVIARNAQEPERREPTSATS